MARRREGEREDLAPRDRAAQARLEQVLARRACRVSKKPSISASSVSATASISRPRQVVDLVGELGRDLGRLGLAVAVAGEAVGLLAHQVDDAGEAVLAGRSGSAPAATPRPKRFCSAGEGAVEVGALAVHLGEVEHHRQPDLGGEAPRPARC